MPLDVAAIRSALQDEGLDGWLLYDFHGSNPIAARVVGLAGPGHMTTRRWYYLIRATGAPRALVHAIERQNLDHLPGERLVYASRQELEQGLRALVDGVRRVAMEYSPACALPYLSRLDAGTKEVLDDLGLTIVSSGDLVQQFEAAWTDAQLESHLVAAGALYRIKDRAFEMASRALSRGDALSEFDLQQAMVRLFEEEGLVSDSPPVVAVGANAGNPHYLPTAARSRAIGPDEVLLLDLWGKRSESGSVFADITWVGVTSARRPGELERAFGAAVEARDGAVALIEEATEQRRDLRGWEIDRRARGILEARGYGRHVAHRTGHSLGESVHGNGVHLDDYETHDDRRLLPGAGFTIEPGLYFDTFGVRTEINVYRGKHDVRVTGPRQMEIVTLR
jgi:Xaa-Pro dipeptidase